MMDWKRKLCSRKFWIAIAGFVSGLVGFLKAPSGSYEAIGSLVLQFGSVVAYIVGEGLADAAGAASDIEYVPPDTDE